MQPKQPDSNLRNMRQNAPGRSNRGHELTDTATPFLIDQLCFYAITHTTILRCPEITRIPDPDRFAASGTHHSGQEFRAWIHARSVLSSWSLEMTLLRTSSVCSSATEVGTSSTGPAEMNVGTICASSGWND